MDIEATHLGKQSRYPQHYDPSVLVAVPRILNRELYGIDEQRLPFQGVDIWHAYEFSFLLENGMPTSGILKISYPASSSYLVESKSLKLYLNSFNMDRYGQTSDEGRALVLVTIQNDLSHLLKCKVDVNCIQNSDVFQPFDFAQHKILEDSFSFENVTFSEYTENPNLLTSEENEGEIKWGTHLLRSNCKITHQPDWGTLYIKMEAKNRPTPESFLKYIVSLRNENHFHEEICEMVFSRILERFNPEKLMIVCLYTRRGGIDICPIRLAGYETPSMLSDITVRDTPTYRQ